ncbi:hypothetical protein AMELA_G00147020 [Ameiurus melas]|uniref:Uncharacterized protein n=1 Tax=Ameiurus melas TaxID=219545 RepID=A0A7J6AGS1_AMEME|nr:hypothetical protein AMELA_G00147020 [Ameiurus melas]
MSEVHRAGPLRRTRDISFLSSTEGHVATRSTPMIVQVEEKSERRPLRYPAEAPGLFSHTYNFKVGSVYCGLQMDSSARMI